MLTQFINYIELNKLIHPKSRVLLAVSGGVDSVVMLDLFSKSNIEFAVVHCNFNLRGDESDGDEKFVEQLTRKYNVVYYPKQCDATKYADANSLSIQESARELRYAWFDDVCATQKFDYIAVAHNSNDRIETFFINLFRGAGITGLSGIPITRGNIVRPLMFASRKQITEYSKNNNITYREDSSNSSDYYLRNKIRHKLIPSINIISPGFNSAAIKSINNLSDTEVLLQSVINNKRNQLFIKNSNKTIHVSIIDFLKLKPITIWAYYLLKQYNFTRQLSDAICLSLTDNRVTGKRFSSPTHELLVDRNELIIREINSNPRFEQVDIFKNQQHINYPINIQISEISKSSKIQFRQNKDIAYFDVDKLSFPLKIRRWQIGDRIIPFGMQSSKLISDILINNKVNIFDKENTYVILSGKKIIWVIGQRSSNEFRVTKNTTTILKMEV